MMYCACPRWVHAREIGRRLRVARATIQDYSGSGGGAAGLAWPLADDSPTRPWKRGCSGRAGVAQGQRRRAEPDSGGPGRASASVLASQ